MVRRPYLGEMGMNIMILAWHLVDPYSRKVLQRETTQQDEELYLFPAGYEAATAFDVQGIYQTALKKWNTTEIYIIII